MTILEELSNLKETIGREEFNPMKDVKNNVLEFPNKGDSVVLYVDYQDGKLIAGNATNAGVIPEFEIEYDKDFDIDWNLNVLHDIIVKEHPEYLELGKVEETLCQEESLKESIEQMPFDKLSADERALAEYLFEEYKEYYGNHNNFIRVDLPSKEELKEEINEYYDSEITEKEIDDVIKALTSGVEEIELYEGNIQLSDSPVLQYVHPNIDEKDYDLFDEMYWIEVDNWLERFEKENNIRVGYAGRSGRHITTPLDVSTYINYDILKDRYETLENDFIDYINNLDFSSTNESLKETISDKEFAELQKDAEKKADIETRKRMIADREKGSLGDRIEASKLKKDLKENAGREYINAEEATNHVVEEKGKITILGKDGMLGSDFYFKDGNIVAYNFEIGPVPRTPEEYSKEDLLNHLKKLEEMGFKFIKSDGIKDTRRLHINNTYKVESLKGIKMNKRNLKEAQDVTDQVIIKTNEPGFLTKKKELQDKGYKVLWTGEGKICMAKPKKLTERNLTRAERQNRNMERIFDDYRKENEQIAKFLLDKGVSAEEVEELKKNTGLGKNALDDKLTELGIRDEYWETYHKDFMDRQREMHKMIYGEACSRKSKKSLKENVSNSPHHDIITKHFDYSGNFDFLDVVAKIIDRIDDYTNEDEILDEIYEILQYYDYAWKVFEEYAWSDIHKNPLYDDAIMEFENDIFEICREIASDKNDGDFEESIIRRSRRKDMKEEFTGEEKITEVEDKAKETVDTAYAQALRDRKKFNKITDKKVSADMDNVKNKKFSLNKIKKLELDESLFDQDKKPIKESITITVDEDTVVDMLMDRLEYWTDDNLAHELYRQMYEDYAYNGAFGDNFDVMEIVDNDWVNYCEIVEPGDDEHHYDELLKLYNENGIGDVSTEDVGFSYIEAAVTRDDQVYFLCRW